MKRCILQPEKVCNGCGTCDDRCELDPTKICDNCFRCLDEGIPEFQQIPISGVFLEDDFSPEREDGKAIDLEDGFVPDLYDDWKNDKLLQVKTLPMTYGARVKRTRQKR